MILLFADQKPISCLFGQVPHLKAVKQDESLEHCWKTMLSMGMDHVGVLGVTGDLVGVITFDDIFDHSVREMMKKDSRNASHCGSSPAKHAFHDAETAAEVLTSVSTTPLTMT